MKCPKCGRELSENDRFCPSCGAPTANHEQNPERRDPYNAYAVQDPGAGGPRENPTGTEPAAKPPVKRGPAVFKAVLAVILYLALFFGVQSCVIGTYLGTNMDMTGALLAAQSGDQEAFQSAYARMMQSALDLVYEHQTLLILIANLTAILILCLQFRLRRRKPTEEFALYPVSPFRLAQFAVLGIALNASVSILVGLLPLPETLFEVQTEQYAALYEGPLLLNLFSVGVVGPAAEEIFFRGLPMTRLEPTLGGTGAIILSSLLFGLAHGTPIAIGYACFIGLIFALIYRKYRTILPGIVCHCFFNMSSYWISESWEGAAVVVLGAAAVLIAVSTWITAVVRYPSFNDVLWDTAGRVRSDDPAKRAVIAECRAAKESGQLDMETVTRLSAAWDKASGKNGTDEDQNDDRDNDSGREDK